MERQRKVYGRTELAQLYFPHYAPQAAWRKLRQWLAMQPSLQHLANLPSRTFTPAQVELIFQYIGEP